MSFLNGFDALTRAEEHRSANDLLYAWILRRRSELFEELRRERPILAFWSHHPGNPDLEGEGEEGTAYLITRAVDVKRALETPAMKPYDRNKWLLNIDDKPVHDRLHGKVWRALDDPRLEERMDTAVADAWARASADLAHVDVRAYVREAALRFTGLYFGIPETFVFGRVPIELDRDDRGNPKHPCRAQSAPGRRRTSREFRSRAR